MVGGQWCSDLSPKGINVRTRCEVKELVLDSSIAEKQKYQTLKGLLSYILFVFVWHKEKHHSGQSPQVKLLIMSNIRYDHVVELIHCSHQIQCKAGTGGLGGWGRCNAGCSNLASFSLQKAARDLWILDLFFVL